MAARGGLKQVVRADMFRRKLIPTVLGAVMVVGSTAGAVYAGSDDSAKELAALRNAKISLAQAIAGPSRNLAEKPSVPASTMKTAQATPSCSY